MIKLQEMAKKKFFSLEAAERYANANYEYKTNIKVLGIYWMISEYEENKDTYPIECFDERPCLVIKKTGDDLKSDEVLVYKITDECTGKPDRVLLEDWNDSKTENLKEKSEIKINFKAKVKKRWIGKYIGIISEKDLIKLAYAEKEYYSM